MEFPDCTEFQHRLQLQVCNLAFFFIFFQPSSLAADDLGDKTVKVKLEAQLIRSFYFAMYRLTGVQ